MTRASVAAAFLILSIVAPTSASAQDVYLDTFDDETGGSPPVEPDLGSYGIVSGTHTILDLGAGDLRLRSIDDSGSGGFSFGIQPVESLERAQIDYLLRIEDGATLVGANDFDQQIIMSPPGTNLSLEWGFGGFLGVRIFAGGDSSQFFVQGFQWAVDTDYQVTLEVDGATDRYTLTINDALLVDNALGADLISVDRMSFRSAFASTGTQQLDDVRVAVLPEPGAYASWAAVLGAIGGLARRRRVGRPRRC